MYVRCEAFSASLHYKTRLTIIKTPSTAFL